MSKCNVTCPTCHGSGLVPSPKGKMKGPTGPWRKCKKCNGRGYVRTKS